MKILTIGTFDIPHMGHYNFFRKIADTFAKDDIVVVCVNTDSFVERFKGSKPLFNQKERMNILSYIPFIEVQSNDSDEMANNLIDAIKPNVIAIGSDWARKDYLKQLSINQDFLDLRGISLIYIPYTEGISTTEIKKRLR